MGAFSLPSFATAMVLGEPTCFIDPDDVTLESSPYIPYICNEGSNYAGLVWVGLGWFGLCGEVVLGVWRLFGDFDSRQGLENLVWDWFGSFLGVPESLGQLIIDLPEVGRNRCVPKMEYSQPLK